MDATQQARFWSRCDRSGGPDACWPWLGGVTKNGYAQFRADNQRDYAHRIAYHLSVGELAPGFVIDHKCCNKRCVNPRHLHAVTTSANMQNRPGPQVNSRSGVRGVHRWSNKWRVQFRVNGRNVSGGYYESLEEAGAVAARMRADLMANSLRDRESPRYGIP